jgi:hypothetical protein
MFFIRPPQMISIVHVRHLHILLLLPLLLKQVRQLHQTYAVVLIGDGEEVGFGFGAETEGDDFAACFEFYDEGVTISRAY